MNYPNFRKALPMVIGMAAVLVVTGLMFFGGCSKTLDGDVKANKPPIVYFVNIPPEGESFSRDPVVYWVGSDADGIITCFQYFVVTVDDMDNMAPADFALAIDSSEWITLDVDPKGPDPQTTNTVSMSADLADPVRTYVDQYVFLRAMDDEGGLSDVIWRLFSRNDNPPNTLIWGTYSAPFINSVASGGAITGARLRWSAEDPIDYPSDPPPFEFQWRLLGPYTDDELVTIETEYYTQRCVTSDGQTYDLGETILRCDTLYTPDGVEISCDSVICDPNMVLPDGLAHFVTLEDYFAIDDLPDELLRYGDFSYDGPDTDWDYDAGAFRYQVLAKDDPDSYFNDTAEYTWIDQVGSPMSDTVYNLYWDFPSDTTLQMNFVFWVRGRDDAQVADLVPAYQSITVINPNFERDVMVIDNVAISNAQKYNTPVETEEFSAKWYWASTLDRWATDYGFDITFDTVTYDEGVWSGKLSAPDYALLNKWDAGVPVAELLKHKLIIVYNDHLQSLSQDKTSTIFTAIDAGVNVWAVVRVPFEKSQGSEPDLNISPPIQWRFYFGIEQTVFSGWMCYSGILGESDDCLPIGFYQDFVGGLAKWEGWPHLPIDTGLLHNRYNWKPRNRWELWDDNGVGVVNNPGLPEVNWVVRTSGTEILYKYQSSYEAGHPLGFDYTYEGSPVALRYSTSLFRTAYFCFTPLAMQQDSMNIVMDSILNWVYDPTIGPDATSSAPRYKDADVHISLEQIRENVRRREAEEALRRNDQ